METLNNTDSLKQFRQPVFGLLVTHHGIGQELVKAAESIVGPQERLTVLSNQNASYDSLCRQIQAVLPADQDTVIMVDYFGGSAHLAVRSLCMSNTQWTLVSGVNLPMLLSFITKRDQLPFSELVEVIRTDAVRGIR